MIDLKALSAPFAPEVVHWRVGATTQDKSKGMALAYIDARDVMERLDEVCTPAGWQNRYVDAGNGKTCCELGINLFANMVSYDGEGKFEPVGEWLWKSDGAGDTGTEGDKGAFSDAFKRAAVRWGIGRYLYDLKSPWVELEPRGNSFIIKENQYAQLQRLLGSHARLNEAQEPAGSGTFEACRTAIKGAADLGALQTVWNNNWSTINDVLQTPEIEELTRIKDIRKADLLQAENARMAK